MKNGEISVYYGGKGKTCVVLGRGIRALGDNQRVVMIEMMNYHNKKEIDLLEKLEPDFRFFCFEKKRELGDETAEKDISSEIKNAVNFANKIVDTGECDLLMLDGILECVDKGYVSEEELIQILDKKPTYLNIILTGNTLTDTIREKADFVYKIQTEKED